jgi:hypothetical protein
MPTGLSRANLEDQGMASTLRCGAPDCNAAVAPGRRQFCSQECADRNRRVQNRRSQRLHRRLAFEENLRHDVDSARCGDLSAVGRSTRRFCLPVRPVP